MTGFFTGPRIAWGPGAIEQLSGLGARRVLLVVDPEVGRRGGERRVVEELGKSETNVEVVGDLEHPDEIGNVRRLKEQIATRAPDWVIVLGGGRTIDAAKAARLAAERPELPIDRVTPVHEFPDPPHVRLVALPTTSGSGAEASWTADLFGVDGGPIEIAHRALVPDWALIDAGLAAGLVADQIVDGAFETLGLAFEAYVSAWSNPFSDALALDAAATVVRRLPHAIRWSDDPDAKAALHYAATAAGLAASNSQRGVAHALARALLEPTGLSYGRLLGIVLPGVAEFDHPSARDRIEVLSTAVSSPDESGRAPLPTRLRRLGELSRLPATLRAAGVSVDRVEASREAIVAHTLRSPAVLANPRIPTGSDVGALVDAVLGLS
ncbi:MAG: iron-containing alcohol dehydrogenase, partial [Thermoplasmata archaeon]